MRRKTSFGTPPAGWPHFRIEGVVERATDALFSRFAVDGHLAPKYGEDADIVEPKQVVRVAVSV